ncbi:baseplate J/gp47 family protein [Streptomyces sparsogenes]|uniref:baseplate J/gp47 family protein n=1 Tax=Streptomyces sparsogenes TaxID=67365 RepID=UPI00331F4F84
MVAMAGAAGRPSIDYMARDYESLLLAMRKLIPEKLPEWRDFSNEADFGNVLLELFAHMGDILSYYQDRVANESFLATARTRRSVIEHLRLIGYELSTAAPATTTLAVSVPASVAEKVVINPGDAFATSSHPNRPSLRFEYLGEAPFEVDFGQVTAQDSKVKVFGAEKGGIPVHEGRLFREELLGTSDETPNQRFPLTHPQVILKPPGGPPRALDDLRIETHLLGEVTEWTRRDSLAFSQAGRREYVVEIDAEDRATVIFGDGRLGAIPPADAEIRARYRVGGGRAGNVPPGAVSTVIGAPALARLGARVFNPVPATGGADREDIAQAVRQAPAVFRSLRRAVTAADYEALALSFHGVGKVRAVAAGWNRVQLYVAPEGGGNVTDVLTGDLIRYFEDKRMLSQIVDICDVRYVSIQVTAELRVESFYDRADVVAAAQQAAAELLAFDRVGFGDTVYLSRFYDRIQDVPGVVSLNITEFRRGDHPGPLIAEHGAVKLAPDEVPRIPTAPGYEAGLKVEPPEQEEPRS